MLNGYEIFSVFYPTIKLLKGALGLYKCQPFLSPQSDKFHITFLLIVLPVLDLLKIFNLRHFCNRFTLIDFLIYSLTFSYLFSIISYGMQSCRIDGSVTGRDRQHIIDSFNEGAYSKEKMRR